MKFKKILLVSLVFISLINGILWMSVDVGAVTYEFELDEDDSFTWEVTEVNPHQFEKVFGFEPNFEKNDENKYTIQRIDDTADGWSLTIEFWDFKIDKDDNGTIIYENVPDSPGDYDENIFIPTPVNDFLAAAGDSLSTKYSVDGATVERTETDYTMTKEYDQRGVLISEEYVDDDGIVLVRVEGLFRVIPSGNIEVVLGFIALAITGIIIVLIKKNKLLIKNSSIS